MVGVDFGWHVEEGGDEEEVKSGADDEFGALEDLDEVVEVVFSVEEVEGSFAVQTPRRYAPTPLSGGTIRCCGGSRY